MAGAFQSNAFWYPAFWEGTTYSTSVVVSPFWNVQMELSGLGNGWTDVTGDVRADKELNVSYGIRGVTAVDRVASTGTMRFTMNSGPTNSAHLTGYYAPDHANCRSGFNYGIRVRLALTYPPIGTSYKFVGTLDVIRPIAGVRGSYLTNCQAVDWLDEAARYHLTGLALQTNVRGDQVFSSVVASMPIQPQQIETSQGLDSYPYALDNTKDESTTALQVFQNLAMSELGYIYIKSDQVAGGTLVYENRSVRALAATTPVQTFSNTMEQVAIERSRHNLLNKVQVTSHPRKADTTPTTILFDLNSTPQVGPGSTLTLNGPFRDPNTPTARIGGFNLQASVATTDYTLNTAANGTGSDLTSFCSVTFAQQSANSVTFTITNHSTFVAYITKLRLRGQGLYDYNTAILSGEDSTSQFNFGQRAMTLDMPYQSDPSVAGEAAAYILNVWSGQTSYVSKLTILGNWNDALLTAVLLRDISDCIALDETVTGLASTTKYFINAVDLSITSGRAIRATYTLAPADQNAYWRLQVVGQSELGTTTRLGYGLISGHVDVDHGDSHSDTHGDAHTDQGISSSTHTDTHADVTHSDVAHVDAHIDQAGESTHVDFNDHGDFADGDSRALFNDHSDAHADIAHQDSHGDTAHTDVIHQDTHGDASHLDNGHGDEHADSHGDSHLDIAHGDVNP